MWMRDPATLNRTLIPNHWARPDFHALRNASWVFTEKVDGELVSVSYDSGVNSVHFAGKQSTSRVRPAIQKALEGLFTADCIDTLRKLDAEALHRLARLASARTLSARMLMPHPSITLFGEGFGGTVQKVGPLYGDKTSFVLFDVRLHTGAWAEREQVEEIADALDIPVVPVVGRGNLFDVVEYVTAGCKSRFGDAPMEGIVARPVTELTSQYGRVITKLKARDFPTPPAMGYVEERKI